MTCVYCQTELTAFEKHVYVTVCQNCAIAAARKSAATREATRRWLNEKEGK